MIRTGKATDAPELDQIARRVADELHATGVDQWSATYPSIAEFLSDASKGALFVEERGGMLCGSISILPENDPAYTAVMWVGRSALVIHRLMVDPARRHHGIGSGLLSFAIAMAKAAQMEALKVDTHPDNIRMRHLLERHGFVHRGHLPMIYREAYELVLKS